MLYWNRKFGETQIDSTRIISNMGAPIIISPNVSTISRKKECEGRLEAKWQGEWAKDDNKQNTGII